MYIKTTHRIVSYLKKLQISRWTELPWPSEVWTSQVLPAVHVLRLPGESDLGGSGSHEALWPGRDLDGMGCGPWDMVDFVTGFQGFVGK